MTAGDGRVWPVPGRREWLRVSPAADGLVAMTVLPAGVASGGDAPPGPAPRRAAGVAVPHPPRGCR